MRLTLERHAYGLNETEGLLWLNDDAYVHTLERPWRAGSPGGLPFESCVPDGSYRLKPHLRPNGDHVLALWNPALHVYYTAEERGDRPGRYLILLHAANVVSEISGCIAPGISRTIANNQIMVRSSRWAMARIMARNYTHLDIVSACGTTED